MAIPDDVERQNALIEEQVKLVVRAEQRLQRTQYEIDRQVTRMELLSRFALGWSAQWSTSDVIAGAMALLGKLFSVGRVLVVYCPSGQAATRDVGLQCSSLAMGADLKTYLASLSGPVIMDPSAAPPSLLEALESGRDAAAAEGAIVVLPIRDASQAPFACLLAVGHRVARASHLVEAPSEKSLPFLMLLCSHLEQMLANTRLLEDLAHAQERLVAANDRLEERVAVRTHELQQEVAERRRAEQALIEARDVAESASRAKSTFLANMSHELRTPLNAIIGYSELLIEEDSPNIELVRADLGRILMSARHLLRLVSDVLDLSKIESDKVVLAKESFDICTLVREVAEGAEALVRHNDNVLDISCASDVGELVGDRTRLAQILLNLVGNAAKFTEHGRITLDVARVPRDAVGAIEFRVTDTGVGMPPEQLGTIFDRFVQADATTSRRHGGTGLGLTISRRLCRLMGGDISVASTPGRGSVFTVVVPLAPAPAETLAS